MPQRAPDWRLLVPILLGTAVLVAVLRATPPRGGGPPSAAYEVRFAEGEAESPEAGATDRSDDDVRIRASHGRVVWRGERPERRWGDIPDHGTGTTTKRVVDERFELSEDGGVPNAFVSIAAPRVWKEQLADVDAAGLPPVEIVSSHERFRPHVVGVRLGQPLVIRNDGTCLLNLKVNSMRNGQINRMLQMGTSLETVFSKKETAIPIGCDVHKWMGAWVFAFDHPWFAVTDDDGSFELPPFPPGGKRPLRIRVWHEHFADRRQRARFDIAPGGGEILIELGR